MTWSSRHSRRAFCHLAICACTPIGARTVTASENPARLISCSAPNGLGPRLHPLDAKTKPPNIAFDTALRNSHISSLDSYFSIRNIVLGYFDDILVFGVRNAVHVQGYSRKGRSDILLGRQLVNETLYKRRGDLAILGILAHEYAHDYQWRRKIVADRAENREVNLELHADFLAGSYLGALKNRLTRTNLEAIANAWQIWDVDTASHGTRRQRVLVLEEGYARQRSEPDKQIDVLADEGLQFIQKL